MRQIDTEIKRVAEAVLSDLERKREAMPKWPVKTVIINMIGQLQCILFPTYFEGGQIRGGSLKNRISVMLEEVAHELAVQTGFALRYDSQYQDRPQEELDEVAADIALQFISRIPLIKERLETDIEAVYTGDPAAYSKAEIIISYPGVYAGMVYRIAHELYLLSVPLIPRIMSEYAHSVTGIDIHPGAVIGKYFFMDHGTGIVIGETTVIGDHVKLYQGVSLGALSTSGGQNLKGVRRHPTISDHVTVYSGASILGGDTVIGEGVTIGGNAFVVKSVPENTRVIVKNPELQFKGNRNIFARAELDQMEFWYYQI
ncbi:MAG: serine acetyltransferase [Zoogloeaceae bacterium]|jgi:serine O-acetyltransferase|nr:serine acetyltransferase [Zoogloeaceae bacterium]